MFEEMAPEEIEGLERSFDRVVKRKAERQAQFSIADPPLRDEATNRAAKRKEKLSEAATPLAVAIRERLDNLLKKN